MIRLTKQSVWVIINNEEATRFTTSIFTNEEQQEGVLPDGRQVFYNVRTEHWEYLPDPEDLRKRFAVCDER